MEALIEHTPPKFHDTPDRLHPEDARPRQAVTSPLTHFADRAVTVRERFRYLPEK
jgi:hypothetical protein